MIYRYGGTLDVCCSSPRFSAEFVVLIGFPSLTTSHSLALLNTGKRSLLRVIYVLHNWGCLALGSVIWVRAGRVSTWELR